ncbi:MAG: carbamoyl-phosphate synthase large subunit [Desulfovibrionaceae bacterium]|nr:carbamoyl-phosphate synthase large subunit [Desulfovibrionaceae bacterium]
MPKRSDLKKIMVIGSGPIVIGQACEFDYSGTQGVKALKEEGFEVVLVNSNPATIMTDPHLADKTYIEPIEPNTVAAIVRKERPDAILPTLGGQTALNTALKLAQMGVLDECGVELIGARADAIAKAESRELFRDAMNNIGLKVPASAIIHSMEDMREAAKELPFPLIIRPAFTLGGTGGGIAYNMEDLEAITAEGLAASPVHEVMAEQSVMGWKEFEMEVICDKQGNAVIVCSIENLDPMGVHTGDSVTVAPAQTLTDREYQKMRDASIAIMREIGVETGGSNVQFGINPANGDMVVIEMNPRVSRSSALASKATGVPIARIAAKLAVGYTLDELRNDITQKTSAAFEPSIDYCVVKIPRFNFEKFPGAKDELTTSMKSVGETMAIGRTFRQALQKGLRSLENGAIGLVRRHEPTPERPELMALLRTPNSSRLFALRHAFLAGFSIEELYEITSIDPWFLRQIKSIVDEEVRIRDFALANDTTPENPELVAQLRRAKEYGFSDRQLAAMWRRPESDIRDLRRETGIEPTYGLVDTCAAEFQALTPYFYSSYETRQEAIPAQCKKVIIVGGGPNRIGQGIEFDYCCCHASYALRDEGVQAIMVNSNPETVSTDHDTSDRLYFEPLTFEDVMHIIGLEKPDGVIVQFGGQTPLNLAVPLKRAGVRILGTSPDAIDRAEDRERFTALLHKLGLRQPENGAARNLAEALAEAARITYPIMVRPSYVLGGRAMEVVYDDEQLRAYFQKHIGNEQLEHPVLIDKFLEDAIEVDVDALSDGKDVYVAGIMEHIEEAGIHSGDSSCVLPPYSLPESIVEELKRETIALALELRVRGLMNIQFAVKDGQVYLLEVNPRASRTVPFVSKATGVPLPRLATQIMLGHTLAELKPESMHHSGYVSVKEAVFPFRRFPGVDILLGPEMRSTGEVMGIAGTFEEAYFKSQLAAGQELPMSGNVFISVNDKDKPHVVPLARELDELGFSILSTEGTAKLLKENGIHATRVLKVAEGRPNILDRIKNNEVALVINTASAVRHTARDAKSIRQATLQYGLPYTTTISAASAVVRAIAYAKRHHAAMPAAMPPAPQVRSLQEYYGGK